MLLYPRCLATSVLHMINFTNDIDKESQTFIIVIIQAYFMCIVESLGLVSLIILQFFYDLNAPLCSEIMYVQYVSLACSIYFKYLYCLLHKMLLKTTFHGLVKLFTKLIAALDVNNYTFEVVE